MLAAFVRSSEQSVMFIQKWGWKAIVAASPTSVHNDPYNTFCEDESVLLFMEISQRHV